MDKTSQQIFTSSAAYAKEVIVKSKVDACKMIMESDSFILSTVQNDNYQQVSAIDKKVHAVIFLEEFCLKTFPFIHRYLSSQEDS